MLTKDDMAPLHSSLCRQSAKAVSNALPVLSPFSVFDCCLSLGCFLICSWRHDTGSGRHRREIRCYKANRHHVEWCGLVHIARRYDVHGVFGVANIHNRRYETAVTTVDDDVKTRNAKTARAKVVAVVVVIAE